MAEARRAEVSFSLVAYWFSLKFFCRLFAIFVTVLFLPELQKKEAARGPARTRSLLAMEAPALKAPSPATEVPKSREPTPAPANSKV